MNLSLSRIFRMRLTLAMACVFFTNVTFAQTQSRGVPDFHQNEITRKSDPAITVYDFQYSKTSFHYSPDYPAEKSSKQTLVSEKSRSKKSKQEKEFPSLLSASTDKEESVPRTTSRKRSLQKNKDIDLKDSDINKDNDLEILEILPGDDQIGELVPNPDLLEKPSLITAQPFEKIAIHFDDSLYQQEKETINENIPAEIQHQKESEKIKKIEMISSDLSVDTIEDQTNDQDQQTLKIDTLKLTPSLKDEKTSSDEIDFESVMSVFGEAFVKSIQKSRIQQFSDNLPDVSLVMQSINFIAAQ